MNPSPNPLVCPFCGQAMVLRGTDKYHHRSGQRRLFFGCSGYPRCTATCGAHPDGTPSSTPADPATKQARIRAHAAFDRLWKGGRMSRNAAYRRLQALMELPEDEAHIGFFTAEQCATLIARLRVRGVVAEENAHATC